jgi:rod shape-determining protein MreB
MAGGTTNVAAVSLDGVIAGVSVNFGANKISADVIDAIEDKFGLQIGLQSAEKLKKEIGSLDSGDMLSAVVNGRDLKTGAPKSLAIKANDILEPIAKYFDKIAEIANSVLTKLPPEVSAEIRRSGIYVSGGVSSIDGLEKYYQEKFGIKINVKEDGLYSVALGGGIALGDTSLLKKISIDFN